MHEDHWSLNDSGDFRKERSYRAIRRYFLVCISDSWYHRNHENGGRSRKNESLKHPGWYF